MKLWERCAVTTALSWLLGGVLLGCVIDMWVRKNKKKIVAHSIVRV